jgi:multidrug efflux pump subunit AcrB
MRLGLSGRLTAATIRSPLTPLFLLAALAVGLIALLVISREEEPQISVPMVDIRVVADGLKGPDAVELVTKPLEAIVKGIDGVEHVYSQTQDDRVMVTARFRAPRPRTRSCACTRKSAPIMIASRLGFPSR